jgi:hypothetical protein
MLLSSQATAAATATSTRVAEHCVTPGSTWASLQAVQSRSRFADSNGAIDGISSGVGERRCIRRLLVP